jgi:hypothetical protein
MVVSWVALGLSALSIAVSLYVAVRDRPRLGVLTRNDVTVGAEINYTWHITVINYGRQSQAISDVGLIGKDRSFGARVSTLRQQEVQVDGPNLPVIISPYSFLDWIVPDDAMHQRFPHSGQEFCSYVVRYSPISHNARLNKIAEQIRSRKRRPIGIVTEYQRGYVRMPER